MSAFFLAINLDAAPFSQSLAEKLHGQLRRFGPDGQELIVRENFALGYQRHWTVPEELGERQPLFNRTEKQWCMFHGRLDNRKELLRELGWDLSIQVSDAELFWRWYQVKGEAGLAKVIGPFVFVLFDEQSQRIVAARDSMGGRYLVFNRSPRRLVVATYEMALAADPEIGYQIDMAKALALLSDSLEGQPKSLLLGATPVRPGHIHTWTRAQSSASCFYLPDPSSRIYGLSDVEYAQEFRRLLDQAVQRRLRAVGAIGSMLSGGLDSLPLSISAAKALKRDGQDLNSYSWVFDQTPEADERHYSEPVATAQGFNPTWIKCDDVWPGFSSAEHLNPIVPFDVPYTQMQIELLGVAQRDGVTVLLSGLGGDMLYTGTQKLLLELLRLGHLKQGWHEIKSAWRGVADPLHFLKRYGYGYFKSDCTVHKVAPAWLARNLARQLPAEQSWLCTRQSKALRSAQYFNVLGTLEGEDIAYGRHLESGFGLERRYPFRDRDLVEFMLAIPTSQLFANGLTRPIVRRAYADELPQRVLDRTNKANFYDVLLKGVAKDLIYSAWLAKGKHEWAQFVENGYTPTSKQEDAYYSLIKWRFAHYVWWKSVCYTQFRNDLSVNDD